MSTGNRILCPLSVGRKPETLPPPTPPEAAHLLLAKGPGLVYRKPTHTATALFGGKGAAQDQMNVMKNIRLKGTAAAGQRKKWIPTFRFFFALFSAPGAAALLAERASGKGRPPDRGFRPAVARPHFIL